MNADAAVNVRRPAAAALAALAATPAALTPLAKRFDLDLRRPDEWRVARAPARRPSRRIVGRIWSRRSRCPVSSAARAAGVSLCVAYRRRLFPQVVAAKRLIEEGRIGQVVSVRTHYSGNMDIEEFKGALSRMGLGLTAVQVQEVLDPDRIIQVLVLDSCKQLKCLRRAKIRRIDLKVDRRTTFMEE